ncbi:hypothetical protein F5Y15DRAFT_414964 [Xylariaceae sp. FL0016]|nr:hypothetical protein F5Y15DRAFT_414964 [Xylariaceae sp. FL0016]
MASSSGNSRTMQEISCGETTPRGTSSTPSFISEVSSSESPPTFYWLQRKKAVSQSSGSNGSRAPRKKSLPRLGAGLSAIVGTQCHALASDLGKNATSSDGLADRVYEETKPQMTDVFSDVSTAASSFRRRSQTLVKASLFQSSITTAISKGTHHDGNDSHSTSVGIESNLLPAQVGPSDADDFTTQSGYPVQNDIKLLGYVERKQCGVQPISDSSASISDEEIPVDRIFSLSEDRIPIGSLSPAASQTTEAWPFSTKDNDKPRLGDQLATCFDMSIVQNIPDRNSAGNRSGNFELSETHNLPRLMHLDAIKTSPPSSGDCFNPVEKSQADRFWDDETSMAQCEPEELKAFKIKCERRGVKVTRNQSTIQKTYSVEHTHSTRTGLTTRLVMEKVTPIKARLQAEHDQKQSDFKRKLDIPKAQDVSFTGPLHVFVDMSNIFIGFVNSWKISQGIPIHQWIKAPKFNFHVLALIMERHRPVQKRVLAGSVGEQNKKPQYFKDARTSGYQTNIFGRVRKASPGNTRRRTGVSPWATSGDESVDDMMTWAGLPQSAQTRNAEQGVDENLHLNIMNSILDCLDCPSTIVLATGDAAEAEFSEGFLSYAERSLDKGWKLELITWKSTISSAWARLSATDKYADRFRIIFLDDFIHELNGDILPSITSS